MILEFGPYKLDTRERVLRHEGTPVPLTPRTFDILLALVQNSGRVLTKQEIIERVWHNTTVEESNLARQVCSLRKILGRSAPQYVETIPWRGYRFNAAVRRVHDSLAVLPFVNEGGDAGDDYRAEGITEGLINRLSMVSGLKVMSRNSVMRYKECEPKIVGKELDVQIVLTGRIRILNGQLFVSAELINTADNSQLWGSQYRRRRSDIFAVQEIIASDLVDHLRLKLDSNHKRPETNPEAYELYLKGRFFLNKVTLDGVRKACDLFTQAIARDLDYAPAHAGLTDCHMALNDPIEAKKAAVKALELAPALGEAHASLGFLTFLYDWDWSKAELELRRAIELNPNYAQARQWYALYLAKMGRHEEASAEAREAQRLDPLSLPMNMTTALVLCFARQYDRSIREIKRVIEMDAKFAAAYATLGLAYAYGKKCNEAVAAFRKASALSGDSLETKVYFDTLAAYSYAASGKIRQARSFVDAIAKQPGASPYALGMIHAQLGDRHLALDWLERAYRERNYQIVWLKVDPALDPLRRTRRFQDLLNRVGLA